MRIIIVADTMASNQFRIASVNYL